MRPRQTPFHPIRRASLSTSAALFENSGQYASSRLTNRAPAAGQWGSALLSVTAGLLALRKSRRRQSPGVRTLPILRFFHRARRKIDTRIDRLALLHKFD